MTLPATDPAAAPVVDEAEIVVVGAGPAGSSCAATLAASGHDVLLVDQSSFPRPKACGDGLGPTGVSVLERLDLHALLDAAYRVTGARLLREGDRPRTKHFPWEARCVSRDRLDEAVLRAAKDRGVRFLRGRVDRPLTAAGQVDGVVVREGSVDTALRARCVIAADGTTSRLRRTTGRPHTASDPRARAIRQYFRTERRLVPTFDFFPAETLGRHGLIGYGWVFPLGDHLANVGIGFYDDHGAVPSLRRALAEFQDELRDHHHVYGDMEALDEPLGAFLGVGHAAEEHLFQRVIFVGDAARMTDPITGEGISHALRAGEVVADIAHDALTSGRGASWHEDLDVSGAMRRRFLRSSRDTRLLRRLGARNSRNLTQAAASLRRQPFLEAAARMVATPDEDPTLDDTAVARILVSHHPDAAEALAAVNDHALDVVGTEFPFATETLHRWLRADGGPTAAATLILAARVGGRSGDDVLVSTALGVELLSRFPLFATQAVDDTGEHGSVLNNALAILVTDFAVARALRCAAVAGSHVVEQFARVGRLICEGEMRDRASATGADPPIKRYRLAGHRHWGDLHALAARTGAQLAGCPPGVTATLEAYGHELGVAMRIADEACGLLTSSPLVPPSGRRTVASRRLAEIIAICDAHTAAAISAARSLVTGGDALEDLVEIPTTRLRQARTERQSSRRGRARRRRRSAIQTRARTLRWGGRQP